MTQRQGSVKLFTEYHLVYLLFKPLPMQSAFHVSKNNLAEKKTEHQQNALNNIQSQYVIIEIFYIMDRYETLRSSRDFFILVSLLAKDFLRAKIFYKPKLF